MSKPNTETTSGLRDIFVFRDQFDVVLACAFEPEENGHTRFNLYDKIGEVVRSIGKKPYLPHREIDLQWPNEKIYSIPNSMVIPTSDLLLCDLGLNSTAGGIMLGAAVNNKIPIIYLFERESDFNKLKIRVDEIDVGRAMVDTGIKDHRESGRDLEFDSVNIGGGNLNALEISLKRFYEQQSI